MNEQTTVTVDEDDLTVSSGPLKQKAALVPVKAGGVEIVSLDAQMTFAQLMAKDSAFIPEHLRGNPGTCLAVVDLALRWGFSPYMVAKQTYIVNRQFAFMSQLIHAVIEKFAPIERRIRCQYGHVDDEGNFIEHKAEPLPTRRCRVYARPKGELDDLEYITPAFEDIQPKNSPLWKNDPDQQLFYRAVTSFCRKWFPDILMGINTRDEVEDGLAEHMGFDNAKVVGDADALHERLKAAAAAEPEREGYRAGVVEAGLNGQIEKPEDEKRKTKRKAKPQGRARAAVKPARATDPKPARKSEPPAPARAARGTSAKPTTPTEYALHVKAWLVTHTDPDAIEKQWSAEMGLRNACGLTSDERKPIRAMVDERLLELN